jgi:GNAT superfamily N-acetyltransferase
MPGRATRAGWEAESRPGAGRAAVPDLPLGRDAAAQPGSGSPELRGRCARPGAVATSLLSPQVAVGSASMLLRPGNERLAFVCDDRGMEARLREYQPSDEDVVVDFALRAWAPVFASLEAVLGGELFARLHRGEGGWRGYQEAAVRGTLADPSMRTWVAEVLGVVVGFVSARLTGDRRVGEVFMLAVDPEHQGGGIGTALTEAATDWLRQAGASVAFVETGGDPGHAPARRVYDKAAYTALPVSRYFKAL